MYDPARDPARQEPTINTTQKRKARDRTRAWRKARQGSGTAEAREIDRAIVAALMHVVLNDKTGLIPKEMLPAIVQVATFILERGHDRTDALGAVEDRLRALGRGQAVTHAKDREASRRTSE